MCKKIIAIIILILSFYSLLFSQRHIAPCSGTEDHSISICYGYAMGRAAGKSAGDDVCDPMTFHRTYIDNEYFTWHAGSTLTGISVGDIVAFPNHVAYVSSATGSDYSDIVVDQVEGQAYPESRNIPLLWVINGHTNPAVSARGNPTGYWRRKKLKVTVENDFGAGNIVVNTATVASGTSVYLPWWGSNSHTLTAIDRQSYGGYIRIFQDWTPPSGSDIPDNPLTIHLKANDVTYRANTLKEFNITIQNNFQGIGNTGIIKVDGVEYNLPHSAFPVTQNESITAQALYQVHNSIEYVFSEWHDDNTSSQRTFER
jgi:hypothetical protein